MIKLRQNIFRGGGVFVSSILFYYAFVCGDYLVSALFVFYGLVTLALTFNDDIGLNI